MFCFLLHLIIYRASWRWREGRGMSCQVLFLLPLLFLVPGFRFRAFFLEASRVMLKVCFTAVFLHVLEEFCIFENFSA